MFSSNTSKSTLRKKYLELRKEFSKNEVEELSEMIFKNFILQFKPFENQKVHLFLSISKFNEINTNFFINYFFEHKIRVFVPKIVAGKLISIEIFPNTEFSINSWGISEPIGNEDSGEKDFDFVIAPLLYCDHNGNRIGYGKGFYDQFFKEIKSSAKKIGVNFFAPNESISDVSENDVPLDYLVLATEVLSFSGTSTFTK